MSLTRRLVAIFYADVAGYSRLTGADEEGTHRRVMAVLDDVTERIQNSGGTVLRYTGDAILAQFPSVVLAVDTSAAIQTELAERNADLSEDEWLQIRIGINLGDVIEDRGEVFGEGVNLAARLEGAAEPGGICLSAVAYDQVAGKTAIKFVDGGEPQLKNIARPVHVWHWSPGTVVVATDENAASSPRRDKPSIAVLPFTNMSGDPEQEFFTDGITEDIITELSRFRSLVVISRNSTFTYKGKAVNIRDVAREFGVDYVVEGSVRKAGERIRVTVQLIDADQDQHIWAERYDRKLEDVFDIQDEVTSGIVATIFRKVEDAMRGRAHGKRTDNLAAYECVLAAKVLHHRSTRHDNAEALKMVERAIELDPKYAHAHSWRACILGQSWVHDWCADRQATWNAGVKELEIALSLDENDADVHRILAAVCIACDDLEKARYHQERALKLNPNYDLVIVQQGELLTWLGQPEEGTDWILKAMRLNPYHPERYWTHLGRAYFTSRHYDDAVVALKRINNAGAPIHTLFAAVYARMGELVSAKAHADEALKLDPGLTLKACAAGLHYQKAEDREHYLQALEAAGLPA